jgi:uridine kinase
MNWSLDFIKTYMIVNKLNSFIVEEAVTIAKKNKTMEILLNTWMNTEDPMFQKYIFEQIKNTVLDAALESYINGFDC